MKEYFQINRDKLDAALKHGGYVGVALYVGLCRIGSDLGEVSSFSVSLKIVSHYSALGSRTIDRYLAILKKAGVIDIESGKSQNGAFIENTYRLNS
jgi:hypothetical protein